MTYAGDAYAAYPYAGEGPAAGPTPPPDPPVALNITNVQPTSFTLNWDPAPTGGPVTSFEVRIDGGTPIAVGLDEFYTFTGLTPTTVYLLEVRALGPGGISAWASINSVTAPASGGGGTGGGIECACGNDWVIHACDLRTGIIRAVLHPVAFEFEPVRNSLGRGNLTLATRDVLPRNIWPHLTSIYVSRRKDDGTFEGLFGGMVEAFGANSSTDGGTTAVGLQPIEEYLNRRQIRTNLSFTGVSQTEIAKALVESVAGNGIAIQALAAPSTTTRDRVYNMWDHTMVWAALQELAAVPGGISWQVDYVRSGGTWQTVLTFADTIGGDRGVILASDREGAQYGLDVDAKDHATLIDALGSGEASGQLVATAIDTSGIYPQFDAAPSFTSETVQAVLQEDADGYLLEHREPVAVPSIEITGNDPLPENLRLGDTVQADIDHGAVVYRGPARVESIAWRKTADTPDTRTVSLSPLTRASESVFGQTPSEPCTDC